MILRPYQSQLTADIYSAWQRAQNVLAVLPTGGGKTVLFSNILSQHVGMSCAIAHRQELVLQMSLALAKFGVYHRAICDKKLIAEIVRQHMTETGASFYDPRAACAVAGVDTLVRRKDDLVSWASQVTQWITDEAHHLQRANKWGKAVELFPNARGLGVTATASRMDGGGLGRHADGVMDALIVGPSPRELILAGHLTDYVIYAPPSNLDLDGVRITGSGDYSKTQLTLRVRKSRIIGDVVEHYLRLAPGKLGVTFSTDVQTAGDISTSFNAAGVPAEVVCAKTPLKVRTEIMRRFRRGDLKQLVNVDIVGEGVDIPALEVISMARPSASFELVCQEVGRVLRTIKSNPGKVGIIIDHVGNIARHARVEDCAVTRRPYISLNREWTLDRREKRRKSAADLDLMAVKTCKVCTGVYEAYYKVCPLCGAVEIPAERSAPEFVDGDLTELDAGALAALQGEIDHIDLPADTVRERMERTHGRSPKATGVANRHRERQEAQAVLRDAIAWWAGYQRAEGRPDSESYRRFYHTFQVDVMTAQTLGRPAAEALAARVNIKIGRAPDA